jgi:transposase
MLTSVHSLKVYIDTGYTDMRKSINGLSILVADQLELDPLSGHLFAFCNRRRDIIKILYWDRNGFCLFQKRLEENRFKWPEKTAGGVLHIHGHELSWLLDGLSLEQREAHHALSYETLI